MLTNDETRHPMLYIKTYDGIGWFVTSETGAVERPARFMRVEEALGWCVQHRPGAEVTIKRYTAWSSHVRL